MKTALINRLWVLIISFWGDHRVPLNSSNWVSWSVGKLQNAENDAVMAEELPEPCTSTLASGNVGCRCDQERAGHLPGQAGTSIRSRPVGWREGSE